MPEGATFMVSLLEEKVMKTVNMRMCFPLAFSNALDVAVPEYTESSRIANSATFKVLHFILLRRPKAPEHEKPIRLFMLATLEAAHLEYTEGSGMPDRHNLRGEHEFKMT